MEQPNFKNEFKKPLEDGLDNITGYREFSDLKLLEALNELRQRKVVLGNSLDGTETEKIMREMGGGQIDAEEMKKAEMRALETLTNEIEEEIKRRSLLN